MKALHAAALVALAIAAAPASSACLTDAQAAALVDAMAARTPAATLEDLSGGAAPVTVRFR